MAGFADTLRGDGLARAHRALAGLERDPQRLDRARVRFEDSPPLYQSDRSGTTTRSQSLNPPSEEQRLRQERRTQLGRERVASEPYNQFSHQTNDEKNRIFEATVDRTLRLPVGSNPSEIAYETIKKRWVEQGIWNNKWNKFASGRWKHEEPLELESESETDSEAELPPPPPLFSFFPKEPQPKAKPRRPKSDEEKRRIAERRVIREREREASRPYHQFIYQISKERERIQDESTSGEGLGVGLPDINTRAYENVKNTWTRRGIWNGRWGILPGTSWKHEWPLEEEAADGPIPVSETALRNAQPPVNHEAANGLFAPLFAPIFAPHPPVESNHREASAVMTTSQQGPPADIDSARLENGDAEHPPSAPNSPRPTRKRVLGPTKGQVLQPSRRKQSQKDGQPLPVASASLGPVHPSKVSKAAGKTKSGRQRRLNISQEVSSSSMPLSSGVDAAEPQSSPPPDRVTPRRSKRIHAERNVASNLSTLSSAKTSGHIEETTCEDYKRESKEKNEQLDTKKAFVFDVSLRSRLKRRAFGSCGY